MFRQCIFAFHYNLFLEKGVLLQLEQARILFTPRNSVILDIYIYFFFFKLDNIFLLLRYHLPLEKGGPIHLNKFESPTVLSLVEIGPVVSGEEENDKSLQRRRQ